MEAAAAFRWRLTRARAQLRLRDMDGCLSDLDQAEIIANAQGSPIERRLCAILRALLGGPAHLSFLLSSFPEGSDPLLGVFALELTERLGTLTGPANDAVARAARSNPVRWRGGLRQVVCGSSGGGDERAADLLESVGESSDAPMLRAFGRRQKRSNRQWGEELTRRLAPRLWVEDLGLISLRVGDRPIDGRSVRSKALALLALLVSQPNGAATPDQLIEALWPDLDPLAAQNSVHQTIYFLRRVFDPDYKAGQSPE